MQIGLYPQQAKALRTRANEVLFGGAAGGGKSHLIRAGAIIWAEAVPGLQIYLFRRTFPELMKNHMQGPHGFPAMLSDRVRSGHVITTQKEIRWWNGSRINLCHLQHEKDIYQYQGAEIHVLLLDEATHFSEDEYRYLRGRVRAPGLNIAPEWRGFFPRILGGTNPGGKGHHFFKAGWVDLGPETVTRMEKTEGGMLRQFIPARVEDNPSILRDDPEYLDRLEGLGDANLVRALREGDWTIVAGSKFGGQWRTKRHTCSPFPIPEGWELWRGGDDGYSAPSAIYWFARNPDTKTIYVINEIYKKKLIPDELSRMIHDRDENIPIAGHDGEVRPYGARLAGMYDGSAFAQHGTGDGTTNKEKTRGDRMNELGCRWTPVPKPPGSRVRRVQNLHRLLETNERDPLKRPGIIFFTNCPNAIRTIPTLGRSPTDMEDVNTDEEDHSFDGITYGLEWKRVGLTKRKIKGS